MSAKTVCLVIVGSIMCFSVSVFATTFSFSTGDPDGRMATASRPGSGLGIEVETADDFVLETHTKINEATFVGLLPAGLSLSGIDFVGVEIYRVFPNDSTVPPSGRVPTRVNSPSDVAFDSRDTTSGMSFGASILNNSFTVANSVVNGIHPVPNQTTLGEGPVTGQEVQFDVVFNTPFDLLADHYYFVPQVGLSVPGDFLWLSAPRPIVPPGTPFPPGNTDLQTWVRNADLDPDWLRVGTDIVGGTPAPSFNAAFSLSGDTVVPEPATMTLLGGGLLLLGSMKRWAKRARD